MIKGTGKEIASRVTRYPERILVTQNFEASYFHTLEYPTDI